MKTAFNMSHAMKIEADDVDEVFPAPDFDSGPRHGLRHLPSGMKAT